MKSLKRITTAFLFSLVLFSCSSDDGDTSIVSESFLGIGVWNLTEVNVSAAQDLNDDGTFSTNLIEELPCLSGVLNIRSNNTWSATISDVDVTAVTGDLYIIDCGSSLSFSGNWNNSGNILNLNYLDFKEFTLSGDTLTENKGENLPGLLSFVYTKQ